MIIQNPRAPASFSKALFPKGDMKQGIREEINGKGTYIWEGHVHEEDKYTAR